VAALTAPEPVTGAFNVGSGTPRTILDMARAITRAVAPGRDPVVTGDWRAGDVRHVFASVAAAADALGFRAIEDFDAGMREFAAAPLRA
jgi:dTDP-L-rhamnose 4-epimerase